MKDRNQSITNKLIKNFVIFAVLLLITISVSTYFHQLSVYQKQCENDIKYISKYVRNLILEEGEEFKYYQKYFEQHYKDVDIPTDTTDYRPYYNEFIMRMEKMYSGKIVGINTSFDELDEETQEIWFKYMHLRWLKILEDTVPSFNIDYCYYMKPNEEDHTELFILDTPRESKAKHIKPAFDAEITRKMTGDNLDKTLYLGCTAKHPEDEYPLEWKTWSAGEEQDGFKSFDNKYGKTYAYYMPLVIHGEKMGLLVTEVSVALVNETILYNTIKLIALLTALLVIFLITTVALINNIYIKRLVRLNENVQDYSNSKDVRVISEIEKNITKSKDEISTLSSQFITLIVKLETYIDTLKTTSESLENAKTMAFKDALTGVKNKTAYDDYCNTLQYQIETGTDKINFAVTMIDLNFLKKINDTYGHDKGNISIKKLCTIICTTYSHSPVFRIGGDEFVIISQNSDYENISELKKQFLRKLKISQETSKEPWERISAAIGLSKYNPNTDITVEQVFKRADKEMYKNKQQQKATRN